MLIIIFLCYLIYFCIPNPHSHFFIISNINSNIIFISFLIGILCIHNILFLVICIFLFFIKMIELPILFSPNKLHQLISELSYLCILIMQFTIIPYPHYITHIECDILSSKCIPINLHQP